MAVYSCKRCGNSLVSTNGASVAVCGFCGAKQTIPRTDDMVLSYLHNRANVLRMQGDYRQADGLYVQILERDPNDAEAHWGRVLCRYGVEYAVNPATGVRIPVCRGETPAEIRKDSEYLTALACADRMQKPVYKAEMTEIERALPAAFPAVPAVPTVRQPCDVFLCCVGTDANGGRTPDAYYAKRIYDALIGDGVRVFYAEYQAGAPVQPELAAAAAEALRDVSVMLIVGLTPESYLDAGVRSSWQMYYQQMAAAPQRRLIPCYKNMTPRDLPMELEQFPALDLGTMGSDTEIAFCIRRIVAEILRKRAVPAAEPVPGMTAVPAAEPVPGMTAVPVAEPVPGMTAAAANLPASQICQLLADGDFRGAREICDRLAEKEPDSAYAYLGRLMADRKARTLDELADSEIPLDADPSFETFLRSSEDRLRERVNEINRTIKARNISRAEEWFRTLREEARYWKTNAARVSDRASSRELQELNALRAQFDRLDADLLAKQTELSETVLQMEQLRCEDRAAVYPAGTETVRRRKKLRALEKSAGGTYAAYCGIVQSRKGYASGSEVEEHIARLQNAKDGQTDDAKRKPGPGASERIAETLGALADDPVLKSTLLSMYPAYVFLTWQTGEVVSFGSFPQNADGKDRTPIEWRVLAKEGTSVLLLCEKAIANAPYLAPPLCGAGTAVSLSQWLNHAFCLDAFNEDERGVIRRGAAPDAGKENARGRAEPADRIFLLSEQELETYVTSEELRQCRPTPYAAAAGADTDAKTGSCWWWLSATEKEPDLVPVVDETGAVFPFGDIVYDTRVGVRPAMWLSL